MHRLPFWILRPFLIVRGLVVNRRRPDLSDLAKIRNPEQFVWAVLPHAARSFAVSILLLPEPAARATAVAYLYARMLDTYEDLSATPDDAKRALDEFASRFTTDDLAPAPPMLTPKHLQPSDTSHLLLIDRCGLVDRMYMGLPPADRVRIARLIRDMAEGMIKFADTFHRQGGVLEQPEQVVDYCHQVIGNPALFVMETISGDLAVNHRQHALHVAELIQLANITRDVEKDLASGVAYHAGLRAHLGSNGQGPARLAVVRARRELMLMATARAESFRHLMQGHNLPKISIARSAAVLMMLFTGRHYRQMALSVGIPGWRGPESVPAMLMTSLPAAWSAAWADRTLRRVEAALLAVA